MYNFAFLLNQATSLDEEVTLALNYDGGSFLDEMWYLFSGKLIWIPLGALFLYLLFRDKKKWKMSLFILLGLVFTIFICDMVSASVIKPYFARLRPSHEEGIAGLLHHVNGYRGGMYGFISSHAANTFGMFVYIALLFKKRCVILPLLVLVCCVCYSRIYLGVHYFGDILFGGLFGTLIGFVSYYLFTKYSVRLILIKSNAGYMHTGFSKRDTMLMVIIIYAILTSIICLGAYFSAVNG